MKISERAGLISWKIFKQRGGILAFSINLFANAFDVSISDAFLVGPKIGRPQERKTSTIPNERGFSGPTIVRSILFLIAKLARPTVLSTSIETFSAIAPVPAFRSEERRVGKE